jgi:peptide/nickel transport system substrate-binding protein
VLDKDGKRFEFELKVPSGGQRFYDQLAEMFKDAAGKIGVRVQKRPLEWSTFIEDYYERRFEAVALYASFEDPWTELRTFHSSADVPRGENDPGWHNAEVDAIVDQFNQEFDHDKRIELFHRFNHIWNEEQPMTLLMHNLVGVLQNSRFEDVTVYPTGLKNHKYWVKPENVKYK